MGLKAYKTKSRSRPDTTNASDFVGRRRVAPPWDSISTTQRSSERDADEAQTRYTTSLSAPQLYIICLYSLSSISLELATAVAWLPVGGGL